MKRSRFTWLMVVGLLLALAVLVALWTTRLAGARIGPGSGAAGRLRGRLPGGLRPPHHHRHPACRCHRCLRCRRRRDPDPRPPGRRRHPVRERLLGSADHPGCALESADRRLPARARGAQQRHLRARRLVDDAAGDGPGPRRAHGGGGGGDGPRSALRIGPGVRGLRRRPARRALVGRGGRPTGGCGHRRGDPLAGRRRERRALLPLGPLLRPPRPLRATGAVSQPLRRAPL